MSIPEPVAVVKIEAIGYKQGSRLFVQGEKKKSAKGDGIMDYDADQVDDAVLALLYLTTFSEGKWGSRAWKGHDWDALGRLHEKGFIGNPKGKAKSVTMTDAGLERSRKLFFKMFGTDE